MVLTSTHNLCFEQKYKKYQDFLSENFHFLVVKFSVYLNRRVFVMGVITNNLVRNRKIVIARFHDECIYAVRMHEMTNLCTLARFKNYFGAFECARFHYRSHGLIRNDKFTGDCYLFI